MLSSTFNNYLWQRLIDDGIELPEINDVFFTNLFNAVCGKTSKYSKYFDEFATAFKMKYYLPWMSNTSQVICALKNEMTTVTKNNIILNFNNRALSTIRWRVLDKMNILCKSPFDKLKKWKNCIQDLTDVMYEYIFRKSSILDTENAINKVKCNFDIEFEPTDLIAEFRNDNIIMDTILRDNPLLKRLESMIFRKEYQIYALKFSAYI